MLSLSGRAGCVQAALSFAYLALSIGAITCGVTADSVSGDHHHHHHDTILKTELLDMRQEQDPAAMVAQ